MKIKDAKSTFGPESHGILRNINLLIILLLALSFANVGNATIYVQAKKQYLGKGQGYRESREEAANAAIQVHCDNPYVRNCKVVSSREYYYEPYANWYWSAEFTYQHYSSDQV